MSEFLATLAERVLVFDGAFGTWMQGQDLGPDDFGGAALEGCNEHLVLTRPDLIAPDARRVLRGRRRRGRDRHVRRVPARAQRVRHRRQDLRDQRAGGRASPRRSPPSYSTADRPALRDRLDRPRHHACRRSARSASPSCATTTRCRSTACSPAASTCCSIETVYDLLQAQGRDHRRPAGDGHGRASSVPLMVQVTVETTGRMLVGTEIGAALTALEAMRPDVIGMNCATGPAEMTEHLRYLAQHARTFLSCLPNAGLPSVVDGHTHYDLTPDALADAHERFVTEFGLNIVGGCCGTTPEHLRAGRRARSAPARRSRARPSSSPAARRSTRTCRSTRSSRTSRSASAPTPTARRSSATRCSKPTGTPACRWRASR